ncbi:cyclase family protein [Clostridium estertheticum]|uniref:Kynurenine formamidase n=1 Tax=Clostridium estertheticum subsp. estertheticum TaxID=1552 RepID=A0A1J0GFP6_9CLOT|nr:cyclase family protein [Clostridium estertheticum]APC39710.1 cyclase [Clostridium estertheticum subsp. estertheticum]MBU3075959.1 cyclase family protein [Clostridium estertheticum]MBU3166084.1 cyclase family protein [Clostridium estertheticum]MBU3174345.1 cyclase family protein [Clostridium estertheticum]MBU3185119.1 cyclase family protein [Clostridium estertheticum]
MIIYDISMIIEKDMGVYKNKEEKRPIIKFESKIPKDKINESSLYMNVHTGTHIDAAFHVDNDGDTIDAIDLTKLIRKCRVIDLTKVIGSITKEDLIDKNIKPLEFLLFKTKNSFKDGYETDFVYLSISGAEYLAEKEIVGVAIDSFGIERAQPGHETHKTLFNKGIIIIEGVRLKEVSEDEYFMCALPLKIKGIDGAPARIVLIKDLMIL